MNEILQITYNHVHGNYEIFMDCLRAIIGDKKKSFIDLGCNHATVTGLLTEFESRKYVDILPRVLDYPDEQKYFEQKDILKTPLNENYDVSMSLDVIEHLYFNDGIKLLKIMDSISDKQILFTPDTEWMFTTKENKDPEAHRSLWTPAILDTLFPNKYAYIHFPVYHPQLNIGAFFFWSCDNIQEDFNRVKKILKQFEFAT